MRVMININDSMLLQLDNVTCVSERLSSSIFSLKNFITPHGNGNHDLLITVGRSPLKIYFCIQQFKCRRSNTPHDVDKPVARHFNTANHSISVIKVCAISPISAGNDSRKLQEKRHIFKIETFHSHGLNKRFPFI